MTRSRSAANGNSIVEARKASRSKATQTKATKTKAVGATKKKNVAHSDHGPEWSDEPDAMAALELKQKHRGKKGTDSYVPYLVLHHPSPNPQYIRELWISPKRAAAYLELLDSLKGKLQECVDLGIDLGMFDDDDNDNDTDDNSGW